MGSFFGVKNDVKITTENGQVLIRDDQNESFGGVKKHVQITAEDGRELIRDHRNR